MPGFDDEAQNEDDENKRRAQMQDLADKLAPLQAKYDALTKATPPPTSADREKADWLLNHFRNGWPGWKTDREFLIEALAEARQEGDRAGWRRAIERIAVWFEIKAQGLMDASGDIDAIGTAVVRQHRSDAQFIRGREYEPPVESPQGGET